MRDGPFGPPQAAGGYLQRNQRPGQVKHEFVMRNVAKQIDDPRVPRGPASKRHEQRQASLAQGAAQGGSKEPGGARRRGAGGPSPVFYT